MFVPKSNDFQGKTASEKKMIKPIESNFMRCSTYSLSNDKISSQMELKKLKLCM